MAKWILCPECNGNEWVDERRTDSPRQAVIDAARELRKDAQSHERLYTLVKAVQALEATEGKGAAGEVMSRPRAALLPCPFCGKEASRDCGDDGYWVQCQNVRCGAIGPVEPFEEIADLSWNERAELTSGGW